MTEQTEDGYDGANKTKKIAGTAVQMGHRRPWA